MTKIDIEQHDVVPMAAKKVWNVLRVFYFMLRKKISCRKLLSYLNLTMKRDKIAGKAVSSLMTFSHHGHTAGHNDHARAASSTSSAAAEYEFSCSNSPAIGGYNYLNSHFFSSLHIGGKCLGGGNHFHGYFSCMHLSKTAGDDEAEAVAADVASFGFDDPAVMAMIEVEEADRVSNDEAETVAADVASFGFDDPAVMAMIEVEEADRVSKVASPMLPEFGRTPLARQLRITDSPFPLKDNGDGGKVDKAAEEFIQKFYRALQKQKSG